MVARGWSDHFRGGRGQKGVAVAAEILPRQQRLAVPGRRKEREKMKLGSLGE